MKIHSAKLENFGIHASREFAFSPGVNLIVGNNGSGKTTLVQAVCWAIWGKLLRPLQLKAGADVLLTCKGQGEKLLRRSIGKSGESVDFGSEIRNSNKTRAADNLQSVFGQWVAWRRTLYVTGRTVSAFSLAAPKGKFEHLVAVTGADVFDTALDRLKTLSVVYNEKIQVLHRECTDASTRCAASCAQLDQFADQNKLQTGGADPEKLARHIEQLEKIEKELENAQNAAAAEVKSAEKLLREKTNTFSLLKTEFSKTSREVCSACGSTVSCDGDEELAKALEVVGKEIQELQDHRSKVVTEYTGLSAQLNSHTASLARPRAELQKLLANETVLEHLEKTAFSAVTYALQHKKRAAGFVNQLELALPEQVVYETTKKVLLAARKRHLSGFVRQIELFTNQYLSVIGAKLRVSLVFEDQNSTSSAFLSSGKLQINASGVGGQSYDELSGGEQRRVDLCLVLAMSQAAAEAGTVPSSAPLLIDEAFDTLDGDGVEALIYLACEVAKTRQVFLISHAEPSVPVDPHVLRINL